MSFFSQQIKVVKKTLSLRYAWKFEKISGTVVFETIFQLPEYLP